MIGAARVADGDGAGVVVRHGPEHVDEFVLILRLHVDDAGDVAEVADVEEAVMGRAVVAAERPPRSMQRRTGRFLQRHVMDDHVVGALHEGGVDREEGLEALGGQAAGEERGVFLGDADVEVAVGQLLLEDAQARCRRAWRAVMATILSSVLAKSVTRAAERSASRSGVAVVAVSPVSIL